MPKKLEKSYDDFIEEGILILDLEGGVSLVRQRGDWQREGESGRDESLPVGPFSTLTQIL